MSQEQKYLTPSQQDALFTALKAASQLTLDKGQPQTAPDPNAQTSASPAPQDSGGMDYTQIQHLFRDAASGHPVAVQPGDKMHPLDAINEITSKMNGGVAPTAPEKPAGIENATGPKMVSTPGGGVAAKLPNTSPLGKLFGLRQTVPVTNPNYYTTAVQSGLLKYLPSGLAQSPDGTPFVGQTALEQARMNAASQSLINTRNSSHPILPSDFGDKINSGDFDGALQSLKDNNIPLTPQVQSLIINAKRGDTLSAALLGRVANQQTQQGADMGNLLSAAKSQGDFKIQNDKVTNAIHGVNLMAQFYNPKTGDFNIPKTQYNEFSQIAAKVLTNNPVLSNEQVNQINQRTATGDFAGLANYLGITDNNGQPLTGSTQSIINNLADTILRQGVTAQSLRDQYVSSGMGAYAGLKAANPTLYNAVVKNTFGTAPDLVGQVRKASFASKYADAVGAMPTIAPNPGRLDKTPAPAPQTNLQNPLITNYLAKHNAKDTPANRAYAAKQLGL